MAYRCTQRNAVLAPGASERHHTAHVAGTETFRTIEPGIDRSGAGEQRLVPVIHQVTSYDT